IHIQIWNNLVTIEGTKYGTVRYTLPQYPRIKDGRTFIPLRFVSEHLGYNVSWNGETREITIESKIEE
ncbi:MAG: copper amine oxidase N-terminal domain-containing protein, partial [Clostridia bacterium]|nr:copper amine oxidase N-terminal domain-containing protein [Clostridia bacterium]